MAANPEERQLIGLRIAQARRAAGMSQREVAGRLSVSTRSVQNYESGNVVPWKHLGAIAALGGTTTAWLLNGDGEWTPYTERIRRVVESLHEHEVLLERHLETLQAQTELLREKRAGREKRQRGD